MTRSSNSIGKSSAQPGKKPKASMPGKSKADTKRRAAPKSSLSLTQETSLGQLVRLHAVTGLAVIYLPPQVQSILGETHYDECEALIERLAIGLIIRQGDVLIEVDLPVMVVSRELAMLHPPGAAPVAPGAPDPSTVKSLRRSAPARKGSGHD